MQKGKIVVGTDFLVKPEHINAQKHLFDAFGQLEPETSAGWIVRLCQELHSWGPFTDQQLNTFYNRKQNGRFGFNGLIESGWIVKDSDGTYWVTDAFIRSCYKSSPADGV